MGGRLPLQCTASPLVPGIPPQAGPQPKLAMSERDTRSKLSSESPACPPAAGGPRRASPTKPLSINRLARQALGTRRVRQNRLGAHEPIRPLTRLIGIGSVGAFQCAATHISPVSVVPLLPLHASSSASKSPPPLPPPPQARRRCRSTGRSKATA